MDFSEISRQARDIIGRLRLSRVESVFLGVAVLFACAVAFFYSYEVIPLGYTVSARQRQIQELRSHIQKLNSDEKKRVAQASNAEKILESLHVFDNRLTPDERGMTQIINEIDSLGDARKILVGDSNYRVEDADDPQLGGNGGQTLDKRDKKPKIYPNLGVETTVVGDYPNLRGFLADLERSKQFLIVNSLSFQGGDERIVRQFEKGGKQIQLSGGAIPVTLKIEFDTYFQPVPAGGASARPTPTATKKSL